MILQITVCLVIDTVPPPPPPPLTALGLSAMGPTVPSLAHFPLGRCCANAAVGTSCSLCALVGHNQLIPRKVGSAQGPTGPFPQNLGSASEWDQVPGCKEVVWEAAVPRLQKGTLRTGRQRHPTSWADLPNFCVLLQKGAFFQHVVSDFQTVPDLNRFLKVQERQSLATRLCPLQEKVGGEAQMYESKALSLPGQLGWLCLLAVGVIAEI